MCSEHRDLSKFSAATSLEHLDLTHQGERIIGVYDTSAKILFDERRDNYCCRARRSMTLLTLRKIIISVGLGEDDSIW